MSFVELPKWVRLCKEDYISEGIEIQHFLYTFKCWLDNFAETVTKFIDIC
jgi:hypothetical protein